MTGEPFGTDRALEERSRELFQESVAELDSATRGRLAAARARALEAAEAPRPRGPAWLVPTGAVAAAIAAAWLWWPGALPPEPAEEQMLAFGDFDVVLEIEMLEEPEFYDWLAEQPELTAAGDGAG